MWGSHSMSLVYLHLQKTRREIIGRGAWKGSCNCEHTLLAGRDVTKFFMKYSSTDGSTKAPFLFNFISLSVKPRLLIWPAVASEARFLLRNKPVMCLSPCPALKANEDVYTPSSRGLPGTMPLTQTLQGWLMVLNQCWWPATSDEAVTPPFYKAVVFFPGWHTE